MKGETDHSLLTVDCIGRCVYATIELMEPPKTESIENRFWLDLDPVDWQQLELLASVSPSQRLLAMMDATEFALCGLRGAFHRHLPDLTPSELNMQVLAYVTSLRGWESP
jgi:hypothetical protein